MDLWTGLCPSGSIGGGMEEWTEADSFGMWMYGWGAWIDGCRHASMMSGEMWHDGTGDICTVGLWTL